MGRHFIDLTNVVTDGGVYVKNVVLGGGAGKHKKWVCVCPICHKEFITQSNHLLLDKITCCSDCSRHKYNDLSGKKFTKLTVIQRVNNGYGVHYLCQCDCGKTTIVDARNLNARTIKSCGCLTTSSLELNTKEILEAYNIKFEQQKTFPDCKDKSLLPFDFFLPDFNILIELQGEQHFRPIDFFGGEEKFYYTLSHDIYKEDFCKENGYKLIQIAYYEDIKKKIEEEIVCLLRK